MASKSKGQPNQKQHFIPVCYLKGFSQDSRGLYVYDKERNKTFPSALKNVGYGNKFYTIDKKFVDESQSHSFDSEFYETKFFAENIEPSYNEILLKLQKRASEWLLNRSSENVLSSIEKDHFAAFIAVQFLRMPAVRDRHFKAYIDGENKRLEIMKNFIIAENPALKDASANVKLEHDPDFASVVHTWLYADQKLIDQMQDALLSKCWAFLISPGNELYSSDQPIVIIPRLKGQSYFFGGLGMKGAQIIFPVAGNILLSMWDHDSFDADKYVSDCFQPMNLQHKNLNNYYQYVNAKRQIYNSENNFALIEELLRQTGGEPLYMKIPDFKVY